MYEGLNAGQRLRGPNSSDEGNPPCKMHGVAADYDLKLTEEEVMLGIARMNPKPNYYEVSLSGNARLIWLFEKPINLISHSFTVFLLTKICEVLPIKQLVGLDEGALKTPDRYFTNGGLWKRLEELPVPEALMLGFMQEVSSKHNWLGPENGPTVPLDVVAIELRKRYPKFINWNGAFDLGAQGPTFWVESSKSPKSAIVRETGLQTFSGTAPKAFYSWSELLTADFVNKFKQKQMGEAVADIYYDEKNYFSRLADRTWAIDNKDNLVTFLKTHKGLSDRVRKGDNTSEVENAIGFIQRQQRVRTAASFAFYPEGINVFNGERILNTHTLRALAPAQGVAVWGPDGNFPWMSNFLDTLFLPVEQLPFFLSWLKYFYTSCHERSPRGGTALFICGGVSVGKTFLNRGVIGGLVGGFMECNEFLMGTDTFNAEIFDRGLWCVDDATMGGDARSHKLFSNMIKRAVANHTFRLNGKYLKAVTVGWSGRVVVTANTDSESLRLLPDLDISIREKICLLKTVPEGPNLFLSKPMMEDILIRELPYLARFLLDMEYPGFTLSSDPRFFVLPYHETTLTTSANHSSNSSAFSEILEDFLSEYFTQFPEKDDWQGTSLLLHKQILAAPAYDQIMRPYNSQTIGRLLGGLIGKGIFDIAEGQGEFSRTFRINRGHRWTKKLNGARVPQALDSIFSK